jgi:hypothetical protein
LRRAVAIGCPLAAAVPAAAAEARRPIPDTRGAVHVWNDQLPDSMTPAQVRFVARHVDGTQKVGRDTARALRRHNRGILVLTTASGSARARCRSGSATAGRATSPA